jgi:hypothetical protein
MRLLTPLETLGASVLFAVVVVPATGAVIELPAIVVTGVHQNRRTS